MSHSTHRCEERWQSLFGCGHFGRNLLPGNRGTPAHLSVFREGNCDFTSALGCKTERFCLVPCLFRAKFVAYLKAAFPDGELGFHGELKSLGEKRAFLEWLARVAEIEWVVYAKPPFGATPTSAEILGAFIPIGWLFRTSV